MSDVVIAVENLSKQYRLGTIGGRTLRADLSRWWAKRRGQPDPYLRIGQEEQAKRFGETIWALRDVNLEVRQGEILGIIGRNGAGKSTLLKILSRITAPTSGQVKVKGRIGSLLEVGTGFHPELTGRENVYLNGAILGMTKAEVARKFDEIVDFSGIEQFIDTPVKRYSSGMYVRLAFAVAAHLEPEILVVDEVLAVGDAEFQTKCLGKMGEVAQGGRTVLFVSHNMGAVSSLCNRVSVIDSGEMVSFPNVTSGVNFYLSKHTDHSSEESLTEQLAKLPEDLVLEFRDLVVDQPGSEYDNFVTNRATRITIEYQVKQCVSGLRVGFDIIALNTQLVVFRSFHDDSVEERLPIEPGVYLSTATIAANTLAPTSYRLELLAGIHNVRWIVYEQVATVFNVSNVGGLNRHYADRRPGVIMPELGWTTHRLTSVSV